MGDTRIGGGCFSRLEQQLSLGWAFLGFHDGCPYPERWKKRSGSELRVLGPMLVGIGTSPGRVLGLTRHVLFSLPHIQLMGSNRVKAVLGVLVLSDCSAEKGSHCVTNPKKAKWEESPQGHSHPAVVQEGTGHQMGPVLGTLQLGSLCFSKQRAVFARLHVSLQHAHTQHHARTPPCFSRYLGTTVLLAA